MFKFNMTGAKDAITQLTKYTAKLDYRLEQLIERLMQEGYDIAVRLFTGAQYAGTNDVEVMYPYWDGDTMVLAADGKAVAFIEFGTGSNFYDYPDPTVYSRNEGLVPHGEFGKKHGKQVRWWYKGEPGTTGRPKRLRDGSYSDVWSTSWGNPPARAMYEASRKFDKQHILEVAKEVFR